MKILYIGPINYGETCHQRMLALQELGHYIIVINTLPPEVKKKYDGFLYRLIRKIYGPLDFANINKQIEEYIKFGQIDLLWIDKGLTVYPETLLHVKQKFPNTIIAGYSPDDMTGNSNNQSRNFLNSLSYYDIYFTTKSYCVEELKALGCSKVIFVNNAFDPHIHKPLRITDEERIKLGGPVGFIGDYEKERASMLINLAQHSILVPVGSPYSNKDAVLSKVYKH